MADDETLVQYTDEHEDGTIERVFVRRTTDSAYPSGWRYSLHYGTTDGETIIRYDNAHEDTKGHERHVGETAKIIDFPGMMELYDRFVREVEKREPRPDSSSAVKNEVPRHDRNHRN